MRIILTGLQQIVVLSMVIFGLLLSNVANSEDIKNNELRERFEQCTEKHGYNPETYTSNDEYALAPNELVWLECAYQGVLEIAMKESIYQPEYKKFIDEHRNMTQAVKNKKITRTERRDTARKQLDELAGKEEEHVQIQQQQRMMEQVHMQSFDAMNQYRNVQSIQRSFARR